MSTQDESDSKTEEATEKKVNDAVVKGQIAFSREVPVLASLFCVTAFFQFGAEILAIKLTYLMSTFLEQSGILLLTAAPEAAALMWRLGSAVTLVLLPLFATLMLGGLVAGFGQGGLKLVSERIKPKWSRISLGQGAKRVFGIKGTVEFLKSVFKLALALVITCFVMYHSLLRVPEMIFQHPRTMTQNLLSLISTLFVCTCVTMALIASADLLWARYSWRRDLRMSHQEVKDEHKQMEGDPLVKARIRSVGRDRARRRMLNAVPKSTLIVANPTHFAVALQFQPGVNAAPVVVAKGQDLIALKIREIAELHGVPVFEDVSLARALYKSVKLDQVIPPMFYEAVAELIRLIYRSNAKS